MDPHSTPINYLRCDQEIVLGKTVESWTEVLETPWPRCENQLMNWIHYWRGCYPLNQYIYVNPNFFLAHYICISMHRFAHFLTSMHDFYIYCVGLLMEMMCLQQFIQQRIQDRQDCHNKKRDRLKKTFYGCGSARNC